MMPCIKLILFSAPVPFFFTLLPWAATADKYISALALPRIPPPILAGWSPPLGATVEAPVQMSAVSHAVPIAGAPSPPPYPHHLCMPLPQPPSLLRHPPVADYLAS